MEPLSYQSKQVITTSTPLQAKGAAMLVDRRSLSTTSVLPDHRGPGPGLSASAVGGVMQRMDAPVAAPVVAAPALPTYLYHAAPKNIASLIGKSGLIPRSKGDANDHTLYLCMAAEESDALTLENRANDVIFRVGTSVLTAANWRKKGAVTEWRGTDSIPAASLSCRRNLGTAAQKAWRPATAPDGLF